jgi:hypothetical protein
MAGIPAAALLLWHSAYWHAGADLSSLPAPRRYWEDLAVAASRVFIEGGEPRTDPVSINSADGAELRLGFQRSLTRAAAEEGVRPWQFWRTVAVRPLLKGRLLLPREIDDPGRAGLLATAFRLLGGIAPFLPLWVGALAAAPVVAWAGWELSRAGRTAAGVVFTLLLACSPYVIDALALPYSAVGFYLIALVAIVPLAAHSVFAKVRPAGLVVRALAAGAVFALCVLCRSGSIFLLPGYALALAAGAWRLGASAQWRSAKRAASAAALLALFLVPYALVRQPRHHEVWLGLWEGLGDFDRTKGHAWDDDVAREVLRSAGAAPPERYPVWENAPENEALFRRLVLTNVRSAPGWYAGILGRRLWATVTQAKLAPWGPRDGISIAPRESPSEGAIDTYYAMATPVDWLGVGPWRFEVPLVLLWGPTLLLILVFGLGRWIAALRPAAATAGSALLVVLCTAVAGLGLPLLFTTAAGLETQAFAIVYFLGFAFLVDETVRYARTRAAGLPAG